MCAFAGDQVTTIVCTFGQVRIQHEALMAAAINALATRPEEFLPRHLGDLLSVFQQQGDIDGQQRVMRRIRASLGESLTVPEHLMPSQANKVGRQGYLDKMGMGIAHRFIDNLRTIGIVQEFLGMQGSNIGRE